jgi:glycine dehydrogenase subunit 1
VKQVLRELAELKVQGGFELSQVYPELGECLLICATETKTTEDIEKLVTLFASVLSPDKSRSTTEKKSNVRIDL